MLISVDKSKNYLLPQIWVKINLTRSTLLSFESEPEGSSLRVEDRVNKKAGKLI